MKWLTGLTLAVVITLSASAAKAQMTDTGLSAGKQTTGQVTSIEGSKVMIKTATGETQTYNVTPSVISALKLQNGSEVVVDSTRLQTGRIVRIGAYSASVQLDQGGETKEYILPRQSRNYLGYGDRVVLTPDLRLIRYDLYQLSSGDLRLQPAMISSSSMTKSTSSSSTTVRPAMQQPMTPAASAPSTTEVESAPAMSMPASTAPVSGLW